MRFLFYDRVTHIEKGKSISGLKAFSLSDEFLKGHFSKTPLIPGGMLVEAMAQLLGWLIIYSHDFACSAIMSLFEDARLPCALRPGIEAEIGAEILHTSRNDSLGKAWIHVGGELIASLNRVIYSHFHDVNPGELSELFRYYSGYDCPGRKPSGRVP